MPKRVVPLTDAQVKNAKLKNKDYKLSDGFGLVLLVKKSGEKLWHFNYTYGGKQLKESRKGEKHLVTWLGRLLKY